MTKDKEKEARMHWHAQNLNDRPGGRRGSILRHGRAWLRILDGSINVEWCLPSVRCGLSVRATQDDGVGFDWMFAVPGPGTLFVSVHDFKSVAWLAKRLLRNARYEERELSLRVHDSAVWWKAWKDSNSWSSDTPKWRDGSFHLDDFLLGKMKFAKRELSKHEVLIPMPEASYPATVTLEEKTWKRPRWFTKRWIGANVDIPKGVPFPGKGENSYDCGQDAVFGQSSAAAAVEAAIAGVVESVLRNRRRYGGSINWRPAPAEASSAAE